MTKLTHAIALVIPTYRETESLRALFFKLIEVGECVKHIAIVDDSEKGQSSMIASEFTQTLTQRGINLHVITNYKKSGRGAAVRQGFLLLLNSVEASCFVEMDADGSHNPDEILNLCDTLEQNTFVIASRYLNESKITGWSTERRIMSRFVNWLIRKVLKLDLKDSTNGFRAYSRESVEILAKRQSFVDDFLYLSEQALVLRNFGFTGVEVPTHFVNRIHGDSSVNFKVLACAFFSLIRLRVSMASKIP